MDHRRRGWSRLRRASHPALRAADGSGGHRAV